MSHLKQVKALVDQLSKQLGHGDGGKRLRKRGRVDTEAAKQTLTKIKLELIHFQLTPPLSENQRERTKQLTLARTAMELACELSVATGDSAAFERYMARLETFYFDYAALLDPSPNRLGLLGLNLLHLLSASRLSEFHAQLELIEPRFHSSPEIAFPLQLEQWLMEGSYNKVIHEANEVPVAEYEHFMGLMKDTVRSKIARCTAVAYDSMPLASAKGVLMLESEEAVVDFAAKAGWRVEEGVVHFPKQENDAVSIPSHQIIQDTLSYAQELERIV